MTFQFSYFVDINIYRRLSQGNCKCNASSTCGQSSRGCKLIIIYTHQRIM